MFKGILLFSAQTQPITIMINNTSPITGGWFWNSVSRIKGFANAHPYLVYSAIAVAAGGIFYYIGWPAITGSLNAALAKPSTTARVVQTNSNLQAESEQVRQAINEMQDARVSIKLEVMRSQVDLLSALSQQNTAMSGQIREVSQQLLLNSQNLVTTHEAVLKLSAFLATQ